jgi:uncharacterized membrane protein (UPF0127 family)
VFFIKLIARDKTQSIPILIYPYDTFFKRLKGLMLRVKPITNEGILLKPCNSIHMFFMFFSIDVVFLDKKNQILYFKERVKPWTFIFPVNNASSALELPAGTITKYSFQIGDTIEI